MKLTVETSYLNAKSIARSFHAASGCAKANNNYRLEAIDFRYLESLSKTVGKHTVIFNNFKMPRRAGWRPLAGRILARGPYVGQACFKSFALCASGVQWYASHCVSVRLFPMCISLKASAYFGAIHL